MNKSFFSRTTITGTSTTASTGVPVSTFTIGTTTDATAMETDNTDSEDSEDNDAASCTSITSDGAASLCLGDDIWNEGN